MTHVIKDGDGTVVAVIGGTSAPMRAGRSSVSEIVDAELTLDRGYVRIPPHLLPVLVAIARRQHTTVDVIVAQAIRDYCEGGL